MRFDGDIIITDPCYIINEENNNGDDWEKCDYGEFMEALGFTKYLSSSTIWGDWTCAVYNTDTGEKIGEFCADAGMVAVFPLKDILKYNPNFDYHIKKPWTTTLIKNFCGEIDIVMNESNEEIEVIGKGNINFKSSEV